MKLKAFNLEGVLIGAAHIRSLSDWKGPHPWRDRGRCKTILCIATYSPLSPQLKSVHEALLYERPCAQQQNDRLRFEDARLNELDVKAKPPDGLLALVALGACRRN